MIGWTAWLITFVLINYRGNRGSCIETVECQPHTSYDVG